MNTPSTISLAKPAPLDEITWYTRMASLSYLSSRPEPCAMRGPPEGSESCPVLDEEKIDYARLLREQKMLHAQREAEYGKYLMRHSKKT